MAERGRRIAQQHAVTPPPSRAVRPVGALVLLLASASHAAAGDKVDRALRQALQSNATGTQSVIVSVNPGCRLRIRHAIEQHGDAIRAEHAVIDALSASVHAADIEALASSACVKAVSSDATVQA